jgi:hypothetical protein
MARHPTSSISAADAEHQDPSLLLLDRSCDGDGMFLHHCNHCGRRELRGPRSLFTDDAGAFVAACRICGTVSAILEAAPVAPATTPAAPAATVVAAVPAVPAVASAA